MAAPRASSFKALRNLQRSSTRQLHITGAHSSPRLADPTSKAAFMSMGLQDLQSECRKRRIGASGTNHELIDRLVIHDSLQSRAFSIAAGRIRKEQQIAKKSADRGQHRDFNTSLADKAVGDSSTVDFAYLPKLFEGDFISQPPPIRVPILPSIISDHAEANLDAHEHIDAAAGGYHDTDHGHQQIMKPQIETAHGNNGEILSHMSDVGDGQSHEMSVESLTKLSSILGENTQKFVDMVKNKDEGTIRQIWNSMLDDVFGAKPEKKA